jgi:predicted nucleic acid-binding protein
VALVLDTGVLLATLDHTEHGHESCRTLISEVREELVVPVPILTELEYLLRTRGSLADWLSFAEDLGSGAYTIHPLSPGSLLRSIRLQRRYADLRLSFVDAFVFITCVELGEDKVATLDRRHFSVLRTEDGRALQIVPELG